MVPHLNCGSGRVNSTRLKNDVRNYMNPSVNLGSTQSGFDEEIFLANVIQELQNGFLNFQQETT